MEYEGVSPEVALQFYTKKALDLKLPEGWSLGVQIGECVDCGRPVVAFILVSLERGYVMTIDHANRESRFGDLESSWIYFQLLEWPKLLDRMVNPKSGETLWVNVPGIGVVGVVLPQ